MPKNLYCQAWSTNNYLLWLVSLLALKNDNTHSLHKPHKQTQQYSTRRKHRITCESQNPLTAPSSQNDMRCSKHHTHWPSWTHTCLDSGFVPRPKQIYIFHWNHWSLNPSFVSACEDCQSWMFGAWAMSPKTEGFLVTFHEPVYNVQRHAKTIRSKWNRQCSVNTIKPCEPRMSDRFRQRFASSPVKTWPKIWKNKRGALDVGAWLRTDQTSDVERDSNWSFLFEMTELNQFPKVWQRLTWHGMGQHLESVPLL